MVVFSVDVVVVVVVVVVVGASVVPREVTKSCSVFDINVNGCLPFIRLYDL